MRPGYKVFPVCRDTAVLETGLRVGIDAVPGTWWARLTWKALIRS